MATPAAVKAEPGAAVATKRRNARAALVLALLLVGQVALGQAPTAPGEEAAPAAAAWAGAAEGAASGAAEASGAEADESDEGEVTGELGSTPPGLFSFGVSAGFPSYQTVALAASVQAQYVGFQLKGSWTAAGPFLGVQLRAYPPVPFPVPMYVGVGGGIYGSNLSYHAALGAHVPLGKNLRPDVEGGVANVPVLSERAWAPHLAVGVSYAFPVELTRTERSGDRAGSSAPYELPQPSSSCTEPREPDSSLVSRAVAAVVSDWLNSAQATFGSVYTDLSYSYSISGRSVRGNTAHVTVQYRGSVREILTGVRHSASGTASATFVWNGCGWSGSGVEY